MPPHGPSVVAVLALDFGKGREERAMKPLSLTLPLRSQIKSLLRLRFDFGVSSSAAAPLSFLITKHVVSMCCCCKEICFVYIWCGCTGLYGKGEGFILCSPPVGFPIAERKREG